MALNFDTVARIVAQVVGAEKIDGLGKKFNALGGAAGGVNKMLGAFGVALSGAAVMAYAKSLIDAGDALWTMHERTGVAVEDLSKFQGAAEQSGTSLEGVGKALAKLNKSIGENDDNAKMMRQLGIDTTNATTAMLGLADVMSKTEDPALRGALAVKLFGRNGQELVPMLAQGRASIEEMSNVVTTEFAQASDEFNDAINNMKRKIAGDIMAEGTGSLREFTETLNDPATQQGISDLVSGIIQVINFTVKGAAAIAGLTNAVLDLFRSAENKTDAGLQTALADEVAEYERWKKDAHPDWVKAQQERIALLQKEVDVRNAKNKFNGNVDWSNFDPPSVSAKVPVNDDKLRGLLSADGKKERDEQERERLREDAAIKRAIEANAQKVASLNMEAQTLGMTNVAREKAIAIAELESSILAKRPDELAKAKAALEAAYDNKGREENVKFLNETKTALAQEIEQLEFEASMIGKSAAEIERASIEREYDLKLRQLQIGQSPAMQEALAKEIEKYKQLKLGIAGAKEEMKGDWKAGAKAGLQEYYDSVKDVFGGVKNFIVGTFQKAEDALVEFLTTGKFNFKAFVAEILKEMLRLWIRYQIIKPILEYFGVDMGESNGGGRALGGNVARGTSYVVGENGPEIFTPAQSGRITPNNQLAGMGGGVSVSVTVNTDTGQTKATGDGEAMQLGKLIAAKVREEIMQQKRIGGLLA